MRIVAIALVSALALSGCIKETAHYASDKMVRDVAYVHDGPPRISLYTMVNNESGAGAHSALVINASQRVIFDPAGTIKHDVFIEQDDVLYGATPSVLEFYTRAHARKTHHVVIQDLDVSPEITERALQLVRSNGPVASAFAPAPAQQSCVKSPDLKGLVKPCSQIGWPPISQRSKAFVNKNYMNMTMPTNASH
jgi:hypothetical protein